MWISEQRTKKTAGEPAAEWGAVTLAGPAAVYLGGERRKVAVCCPGGFAWRPKVGDEVLVLKAGPEGEQPYILGLTRMEEVEPGQVRVGSRECGVLCGETLELTGEVRVNGEELEELVRRIAGEVHSASSGMEG